MGVRSEGRRHVVDREDEADLGEAARRAVTSTIGGVQYIVRADGSKVWAICPGAVWEFVQGRVRLTEAIRAMPDEPTGPPVHPTRLGRVLHWFGRQASPARPSPSTGPSAGP